MMTSTTETSPAQTSPVYPTIIEAIETLNQCTQGVVFTALADSTCSPTDYACICQELLVLDVETLVRNTCTPAELAEYLGFQSALCPVATSSTMFETTTMSSTTMESVVPTPVYPTIIEAIEQLNQCTVSLHSSHQRLETFTNIPSSKLLSSPTWPTLSAALQTTHASARTCSPWMWRRKSGTPAHQQNSQNT
jgi:hypothetical protein